MIDAPRQEPQNFVVDLDIYPLDVVMAAGYSFIDRFYVLIDKESEGKVKVSLSPKPSQPGALAERLADEFSNELLGQALRREIGKKHEKVREVLLARALFGAAPKLTETSWTEQNAEAPIGVSDGLAENDDYLDDPLGIAVPWEEKFGKGAGETEPRPADPPEGAKGQGGGDGSR
jgi:His-Xaa-Ser system protein HxsD